jgi:uncharacterized protein (DUF58 family)
MRRGTILFLLVLILAVAFFGLLNVFQAVLVTIVTLLVLFFGAIFLGAWLLKRRMNRKLAELQQAFVQGQRDAEARRRHEQMRSDAIDVEPTDVRDDRR